MLLACLAWSGPVLAVDPAAERAEDVAYPSDLAPDHFAYRIARDLARKGILKGFPDGTFRGSAPVNRFQLAVAIDRTLAELSMRPVSVPRSPPDPARGRAGDATMAAPPAAQAPYASEPPIERVPFPAASSDEIRSTPLALNPADSKALAKLTREFAKELSTLRVRTAGLEERTQGQRRDIDGLKSRVDRIAQRIRQDETFRFRSGELRLAGFSAEETRSFTNLILNFDYRISERITGVFSPQLFNQFDRSVGDTLDVWEAYADFADFGIVNNVRAGRQLMLVGAGLTLFNRVEAFNFTSTYNDTFFQLMFLGDAMFLVEGRTAADTAYGFYFIQQSRNGFGKNPLHLGAYVRGKIGRKLYVGGEYANYSNRMSTPLNNDIYTQGYLVDAIWEPSSKFRWRQCVIAAEEDFRAVSIDRDLAFHSPVSSPLEDVLQTLSFAERVSPIPTSKNEINGFWDVKTGLEFQLPRSKFRLGLDWDRVRDYTTNFNNSRNGFDVWAARLRRPLSNTSWMEFRARRLDFEFPHPDERVGTLDVARIERTDLRLQWFGRF